MAEQVNPNLEYLPDEKRTKEIVAVLSTIGLIATLMFFITSTMVITTPGTTSLVQG
jgi:hypothetical protein